jgi:rhodanese-related sulfurtransferase
MKTLSPKQTQDRLQQGHCCPLDVRTPIEFREKHITGSRHIPLDTLASAHSDLDPADPLLLICQSGQRAHKAAALLAEQGFRELEILEGGLQAWEEQHLPLERPTHTPLSLMRQVQLTIGLGVLAGALLALLVDVRFALLPAVLGVGLTLAGATGWCGLALFFAKAPWNRVTNTSCAKG